MASFNPLNVRHLHEMVDNLCTLDLQAVNQQLGLIQDDLGSFGFTAEEVSHIPMQVTQAQLDYARRIADCPPTRPKTNLGLVVGGGVALALGAGVLMYFAGAGFFGLGRKR